MMQKSALSLSCRGFWNLVCVPCSWSTLSIKVLSVALGNQHSSSSRARIPGGLVWGDRSCLTHIVISRHIQSHTEIKNTDRPLNEVDAGLQVQAEVDEAPLDALPLVLLLLQDEHGVVEELLQFLIGVVDAQLLKWVQLKGNVRQLRC